jgi:ATP-binding cassette subfamily F protein uup
MLLEFAGTALIVSHDRWFLDRVASEILAFEGGGVVTHYPGSYSTYRALRDAAQRVRREEKRIVERPPRRPSSPKKSQGLTYAERLELQQIEQRVEQAEATVRALEVRLADPALYQRPDGHQEATRLDDELRAARAEVETLTARWEALELKREEVSK